MFGCSKGMRGADRGKEGGGLRGESNISAWFVPFRWLLHLGPDRNYSGWIKGIHVSEKVNPWLLFGKNLRKTYMWPWGWMGRSLILHIWWNISLHTWWHSWFPHSSHSGETLNFPPVQPWHLCFVVSVAKIINTMFLLFRETYVNGCQVINLLYSYPLLMMFCSVLHQVRWTISPFFDAVLNGLLWNVGPTLMFPSGLIKITVIACIVGKRDMKAIQSS